MIHLGAAAPGPMNIIKLGQTELNWAKMNWAKTNYVMKLGRIGPWNLSFNHCIGPYNLLYKSTDQSSTRVIL